MKKSLIALAALATVATAAQAQSNVTIYGVIDVGVASVSGVAKDATTKSGSTVTGLEKGAATERVTGMQNGGSGTSRWGMRGTEDLGQGLKANFTLESEFLADTGSTKSSAEALFNRESSVGLQGSFGEVKLGRMNTFSYAQGAKFDPFGGNNIGGYIAVGQHGYSRIENTVQYVTPKFSGVQVGVQSGTRTASQSYPGSTSTAHTFGEVAGENSGNRNTGYFISYDHGPLAMAMTYGEQKDGAGLKLDDTTQVFASYNFGSFRPVAGYQKKDYSRKATTIDATNAGTSAASGSSTTLTDKELNVIFVGFNYDLTSNLTLKAFYEQLEYTKADATKPKQKPTVYTLGLNYALSKRTSLYGVVSQSNQDNDSAQAIVSTSKFSYADSTGADKGGMSPVKAKDQTAYMIGVRHNF